MKRAGSVLLISAGLLLLAWHWRCPDNPDFTGELAPPMAVARTEHWFNPCELLGEDARSELKPGCRRRAPGGGWEPV